MPYYAVVNGREEGVSLAGKIVDHTSLLIKVPIFVNLKIEMRQKNIIKMTEIISSIQYMLMVLVDIMVAHMQKLDMGFIMEMVIQETCQYHWMTLILMELFQLINELNFGQ